MRKEKGITLIALVVTIIVLLILAGVTISMMLGNSGVITQSSKAVTATNVAKVKEEVSLALASIESEYYTAWASNNSKTRAEYYIEGNLEKYLQGEVQYTANSKTEAIIAGEEYIVVYSNVDYEVIFELNTNGSYSLKQDPAGKGGTSGGNNMPDTVQVISITLSETNKQMEINDTFQLIPTVAPINATNQAVGWSSNDESIATVSGSGLVIAKEVGTALITCTAKDGSGISSTCAVTVEKTGAPIASAVKVGDYVNYTPPSQNYTMTIAQTGYTSGQSYTTSSYTGGWQVLYNDVTNGVQLISSDNILVNESSKVLYLREEDGYNNLVGTLNTMAGKYVNTAYAVSGRSVGSLPSATQTSTGTTSLYTGSYTYFTTYGWNNKYKVADTNYTSDQTAMTNAGVITCSSSYWLASRNIAAGSTVSYFGGRCILENGSLTNNHVWYVYSVGDTHTQNCKNGVRPVITLKSDVLVNISDATKDGTTQETAWELK